MQDQLDSVRDLLLAAVKAFPPSSSTIQASALSSCFQQRLTSPVSTLPIPGIYDSLLQPSAACVSVLSAAAQTPVTTRLTLISQASGSSSDAMPSVLQSAYRLAAVAKYLEKRKHRCDNWVYTG